MKAITNEIIPALIDSWPSEGPTTVSWMILAGAGTLPELSTLARSLASWMVKSPVICDCPLSIFELTRGAE